MSRDPTITLNESNLAIGPDGRMHYTFTANDDNQKVRLASDCLGTTHFNQLMIERGDKATSYVAPVVVEGTGNPTGLFKDLKEISLELTDTANSNLWSKIKLTTNGMLREYHRDHIKTEIIETADGIATRISEGTDKKLALINDTVDGIRREYQDADRRLSSSYQAGINGLKAIMRDDKLGLQAEIKASASGIIRQFENQMTGLQSSVAQTSDKIVQEIRDRTGAVSQIQSTVDSYVRRLRDAEGNYNSLKETVSGYERRISNQDSTIQSNFTQLKSLINASVSLDKIQSLLRLSGDSIMLAIKDKIPQSKMSGSEIISAINLNSYGVQIAGKQIALDGNTVVSGTFTTKIAEAIKIKADQIIAGTLDASKARIINLNASSIVGLDANFIKAKIGYAITDLLEGKVIKARNGAMAIDLNKSGINFYTDDPALKRVLSGYPNQFVKFATGNVVGKGPAGVTVIGSNRWGTESSNDGGFVGMRAWNGKDIDNLDLVGDIVYLVSSAFDNKDGWEVTTTGKLTICPNRRQDRRNSAVQVGDIHLFLDSNNTNQYTSLHDFLRLVNRSLKQLGGTYSTNKDLQ
ncbi:gp58-like family protein [Streptococcus halichoeri]|uniref:gp58-like family protein n=1 Tax=Streptococcus halichoeri TaxID=254785 RepID=UPI00135A7E41|nr:gp58-like family protein [Streptococcus halichoeri]